MNSSPTVFHLDDALSWRGGEQQVLYLHRGLLRQGWRSVVICRPGSEFQERLRGFPRRCAEFRAKWGFWTDPFDDPFRR